jgi:tetratricopeptide (TPR) repeat protein
MTTTTTFLSVVAPVPPNGHRGFDRSLVPSVVVILLLTAGFSATPARGDVPLLTHPDASWSLRLDLPGFEMKPPRVFRDRSQVWVQASSKGTGVILTVFVEKMTKLRETSECRDDSLKKMAAARKRMTLSEHNDWALAEDAPAEGPSGQAGRRTLHAYLYHDNFCVDAQISKEPFLQDDRKLFFEVLDGLSAIPASREEMARATAYMPLSGPAEQIALEAAQKLRAKDFAAAEVLLLPLCPEAKRQSGEARSSPDCSLRNAGLAEARNINQGRDLATIYWRAGDLLAKDGRPDAALEVFRKGLDVRSDHADIWYSIGQAQRDRNDLAAAGVAFTKALELRPNDARTMFGLASNLIDQGKLVEADAMLDRVQKVDPKEIQVWFRRGEIQMLRGRYTEAIATFEKAKDLGVDEVKVRAKIKECRDALARQRQ